MVRRGSTVRVRQRALQSPCKSADLCSGRLADSAACGGYGAVYGAFKLQTPPTAASECASYELTSHHRAIVDELMCSDEPDAAPRRGCGGVWRSIRLSGTPSATIARLSPPSRTESPSMNDEEQVPQARTPAAPADAGETPVEKLEALGVRGILWQLARDGQIIDVRCEMPQCYCFRGRRYFEPRSPRSDW